MADVLFNSANSLFVDENFEAALEAYSKAIEADNSKAEYYLKRSACNFKLKNFTDALDDANASIRLEPSNAQGFLRKGMACFSLDEYETAKVAFEKGQALDPANASWKTWLRKCDAELAIENGSETNTASSTTTTETPASAPAPAPAPAPASAPAPAPAPAKPTLRHEFFQTATHVVISVFAKGLKKEDVEVEFQERSLSLSIKQTNTGSEFQHTWELFDEIVTSESSFFVGSVKIELKLKKKNGVHWPALEKVASTGPARAMNAPVVTEPPAYPTSSRTGKKNWDAIANSVEEDKLEGEQALNKIFQDIFSTGSEETRKAMMKSYVESGGTVLSTNWDALLIE